MAHKEAQALQRDETLYRDPRPLLYRIGAYWQRPKSVWAYLFLALAAPALPGMGPVMLLVALTGIVIFLSRTVTLPIHIPITSPVAGDPHDPDPATGKPRRPRGIYYLGNTEDGEEVWENKDALTTHLSYLATTGGGKTVGLTSFMTNALIQGAGAFYTDGKAQMDVPVRIMSLAHRFGRFHDCLFLNFMQGGASPWEKRGDVRSTHRFSFLKTGSASAIAETLLSLLKVDDDMWGQRAKLFLRAIGYIVVYLRDTGQEEANIGLLVRLLNLRTAMEYAGRDDMPEEAAGLLKAYLENLPGMGAQGATAAGMSDYYDNLEGDGNPMPSSEEISEETLKQHGYITMQLVPLLAPLEYEYGDQLSPEVPDIDIVDVAINNRILVNALPALEKSSDSVASLGRVVVAATKAMMAGSLYTDIEGDVSRNLDSLPTNSDAPYPVIWDEIGAYFTEDHGTKFAMARSLNFIEILGTQDLPAMKKLGDKAAKATETVLANTGTKIIGRTEDGGETIKYIRERADQGVYAEQTQAQVQHGLVRNSHIETGISMVRRDRLTIKKLARLKAGEVYWLWEDQVIRGRMFYAHVDRIRYLKLPYMVNPPTRRRQESPAQQDREKDVRQMVAILREAADPQNRLPSWVVPRECAAAFEALDVPDEEIPAVLERAREQGGVDAEAVLGVARMPDEGGVEDDEGGVPTDAADGGHGGGPEKLRFGDMAAVTGGYWGHSIAPPPPAQPETPPLPEGMAPDSEEAETWRGEYERAVDAVFAALAEGRESLETDLEALSRHYGGDPEAEKAVLREAVDYAPGRRDKETEDFLAVARELADLAMSYSQDPHER